MTKILVLYYDTCMSPSTSTSSSATSIFCNWRERPAGAAISQMAQGDALSYNCKLFTLEVPLAIRCWAAMIHRV